MTIREWLNSEQNYSVGIALYDAYGTDVLLKKMFGQGFSDLRAKRLKEELIAIKEVSNRPATASEPEYSPVQVETFSMPEQKVPGENDRYRHEWLPLYQEMNLLRHSLEACADDKERGATAHRILDLEQECMCIWSKRDYWLATGKELQQEEEPVREPVTDPNLMMKRLQTVRTYISKYRKSTLQAHKDKLADYELECRRLMDQLNLPQ